MFKVFLSLLLFVAFIATAEESIGRVIGAAKALRYKSELSHKKEEQRVKSILVGALMLFPDYGSGDLKSLVAQMVKHHNPQEELVVVDAKETPFFGGWYDEIFLIQNKKGQLRYVVKAFASDRYSDAIFAEISGMMVLKESKLKAFHAATPLAVGKCVSNDRDYRLLLQSVAKGRRLYDYLIEAPQKKCLQVLRSLGDGFAEMHTRYQKKTFITSSRKKELREQLASLSHSPIYPQLEEKIDLMRLNERVEEAIIGVSNRSFKSCFSHGDPNLKNIFFDESNGKFTFVDIQHMHRSIDSNQLPLADRACDIFRFEASLHWLLLGFKTEESVNQMFQAFLESYIKGGGMVEDQLVNFYSLYNKLQVFNRFRYYKKMNTSEKNDYMIHYETILKQVDFSL